MRNSLDQKGRGEGEKRESRKQNEYRKQTGTGERKSEWERVRGEKPEALNCCGGRHCNFPLYTFLRSSCRALSLSLFVQTISLSSSTLRSRAIFLRSTQTDVSPSPSSFSASIYIVFPRKSGRLDGNNQIYMCIYIYKSISSVRLVQSVMQSGSLIDRPFRCPIKLVLFEFFFFLSCFTNEKKNSLETRRVPDTIKLIKTSINEIYRSKSYN